MTLLEIYEALNKRQIEAAALHWEIRELHEALAKYALKKLEENHANIPSAEGA